MGGDQKDDLDDNYERNLPKKIVRSLDIANDSVADLNMTLSQLESVDILYLNGNSARDNKPEVYISDAIDFISEIGPYFPEMYKNMQTPEGITEERITLFEHYVNTLLYELRKQCCEKAKVVKISLNIPKAYAIALKSMGLDTEEATIVSLTPEELDILPMEKKGDESRSIIISPNQVDSEYINIRVNDILDDLKPIWEGFFSGNANAVDILQKYLQDKIEYREFFSEITALPNIKVIEEDDEGLQEDIA